MGERALKTPDDLANVFLDGLTDPSVDLGWHGDSLMARCIEYAGYPPAPTGNDKSNEAMMGQIRWIGDQNPQFANACEFFYRCFSHPNRDVSWGMVALLAKNYYRGVWTNEDGQDYPYTDAKRAEKIGLQGKEREFKRLLASGNKIAASFLSKHRKKSR